MISPNTGSALDKTSYTVDSLTFYLTGASNTYPDSVMVLVSTTDTDPASFTMLPGAYVQAPVGDYVKFTFALPNAEIRYIAFRYLLYDALTNGYAVGLDNVRITRYTFENRFVPDPASMTFGFIPVGFTQTQTLKIRNMGNLPLNISSVTSSNLTDFSVTATIGVVVPGDSMNVSVTFQPASTGVKSTDIIFVHDADSSPDTVVATGTGGSPMMFTTLAVDSVALPNPLKPWTSIKVAKRFAKIHQNPNWSNLLTELVAQGGFQPGTSESDSAGGARVGVSYMYEKDPIKHKWSPVKDSAKVYCWVRVTSWDHGKRLGKGPTNLQKTLLDKTGLHTGYPHGLDSTLIPGVGVQKRKFMKGQLTKLVPKKGSNPLFAEMVALKINIASSALGKTPAGLGELTYHNTLSAFDGMTVKAISARIDSMLTYWRPVPMSSYDDANAVVHAINNAFVGPLDTVTWEAGGKGVAVLTVKGAVNLAAVPFLTAGPGPFVPTVVTPTNTLEEAPEDFEDSEYEDFEAMPVAAKLYQNYPNPFNPTTTIAFMLKEESMVSVRIYNVLGQQVATLLDGEDMEGGYQTLEFNALNLASGIYFYQIDVQGLGDAGLKTLETHKMLLVK